MAQATGDDSTRGRVLRTVSQLRGGTSLERLCNAYRLTSRRHSVHPIVQLSYSQRESNLANAIVQECRGLIIEADAPWRPVCMPFDKFFNADEPNARATQEQFDWSSAKVFEKCDGSLLTLYWYSGRWNVASSSLPAADGQAMRGSTFAECFWRAWEAAGWKLPSGASSIVRDERRCGSPSTPQSPSAATTGAATTAAAALACFLLLTF